MSNGRPLFSSLEGFAIHPLHASQYSAKVQNLLKGIFFFILTELKSSALIEI